MPAAGRQRSAAETEPSAATHPEVEMDSLGSSFEPIPRVLHQIWDTPEVPPRWAGFRESWARHHPHWELRLWTHDEHRRLVAERYPQFRDCYETFDRDIQRIDAAKYLILHAHGGAYADLDCECLRSVEPLVAGGGALFGRTLDGVIEGSFFASPPGHAVWELMMEEMSSPPAIARFFRHVPGFHATHVLFSTGPRMLKRAVGRYRTRLRRSGTGDALSVCDPRHFSSRPWLQRDRPFRDRDAYLRHHYSHSWLRPSERRIVSFMTSRRIATACSVLLLVLLAAVAVGLLR